MQRVNAFLVSSDGERLVTMAYVELCPPETIATVVLAGHPAPLLVPRTGAPATTLDIPNGPLLDLPIGGRHDGGPHDAITWQDQTVLLPDDADLVLYTDGLVDFPQAAPAQLDRLLALATSAGGQSVAALADALIASAPSHDDVAVLVARPLTRDGP